MPWPRPELKPRSVRLLLCLAGTAALAGCSSLPNEKMFALGGVDANSAVAAEVAEASNTPGPYPRIDKVPSKPTDIRPATAWKTAVLKEEGENQQLQSEAAAIQFTLKDTDAYAAATRAKISPALATQAPTDAEAQAQAFAEAEGARATPPPKPN